MGAVLDTTVFIDVERATLGLPAEQATQVIGDHLRPRLQEGEEVAIAAITASELLHGVHRADDEHRGRRETFVETILAEVPVLGFDLFTARVHAKLWAGLAAAGVDVAPHDRLVAATAMSVGWRVGTANIAHFNRIPGLDVALISLA